MILREGALAVGEDPHVRGWNGIKCLGCAESVFVLLLRQTALLSLYVTVLQFRNHDEFLGSAPRQRDACTDLEVAHCRSRLCGTTSHN
jgi:hypothetical protein